MKAGKSVQQATAELLAAARRYSKARLAAHGVRSRSHTVQLIGSRDAKVLAAEQEAARGALEACMRLVDAEALAAAQQVVQGGSKAR